MAILKNININSSTAFSLPSGTTAERPSSPVSGMIRYNTSFNVTEYYDGTSWKDINTGYTVADGSTSALAADSAEAIIALTGTTTNGVYWINLPTVGPTQLWCLMNPTIDGGGWMMAMKATRGTTFNYSANYWTTANTLNPGEFNVNDGDAKFNTFNYFQGRDLLARWPDITTRGGSIQFTDAWYWLERDYPLYIGSSRTSTMLNLFNTANRTMIRDAKTFSGWRSGIFSSQVDVRFYGFNWTDNMNCRWGFGWNENGGGLHPNGALGSDDVSGGIGMSYNSFSAGDSISCCQDTTGINRSARVEVYVR
jgi:hypothetical protein